MNDDLDAAVESIKGGQVVIFNDFRIEPKGEFLLITGWSQYSELSNITKDTARVEVEEIKHEFLIMSNQSRGFRNFVDSRLVEYILAYDDAGKTSINICSLKDDVLTWIMHLR